MDYLPYRWICNYDMLYYLHQSRPCTNQEVGKGGINDNLYIQPTSVYTLLIFLSKVGKAGVLMIILLHTYHDLVFCQK